MAPMYFIIPIPTPTLPGDDLWEVLVNNSMSGTEKWINSHHNMARAMIDLIDGKTPEYELCFGPSARVDTEMAMAARLFHIKGARIHFPLKETGDPFDSW